MPEIEKRGEPPGQFTETPLSQVDAFFVAYQEQRGILMQVGAEAYIAGTFSEKNVREMLEYVIGRWPQVGQRLRKRIFGLAWSGRPTTERMFRRSNDLAELDQWRNRPIDPFSEPPFQVLWVPSRDVHFLYFRGHHASTDGESFFYVAREALRALALSCGGAKPQGSPSEAMNLRRAIARAGPVRLLDLWPFAQFLWRLRKEARSPDGVKLWMRTCMPGDIGQCERVFEGEHFIRFNELSGHQGISPMWFAAAAWIKAIHRWNTAQADGCRSMISLEFPVSLRRGRHEGAFLGNLLSPLIVYGDGSSPIEGIASSLKQQLFSSIRRRMHLAVPCSTGLGAKLQWSIFRRLATTTSTTGFATSHFTWLPQEKEFLEDMVRFSNGAVRITRQKFYTPVCLHMGAALSVLSLSHRVKFCITYRRTALTEEDANSLADFLVAAALQADVPRDEVKDRDYSDAPPAPIAIGV